MKESCYVCNHAAGFTRCMTKRQEDIQLNVRIMQQEMAKGKSSQECKKALDDLNDLTSFNQNVAYCVGKATQHLADVMFIQMANFTLLWRDFFLDRLKHGVKQDNWSALRNAPLHLQDLFHDDVLRKAEDDVQKFEASIVPPNPHRVQGG